MSKKISNQDKKEILEILAELIRIPSVNTGNPKDNPEAEIAKFIIQYIENIGMQCENIATNTGRPNIIGRWRDNPNNKPTLTLNAHMDTVNVDGMTIDPFNPEIKNGRIYGRGSCDTKGSLAVFLWAIKRLSNMREELYRHLEFLATCDEENHCSGSCELVNKGYKADEMIIGEPTNCQIATAHRGLMIIKLRAKGVSVHASVPHAGDNAIYKISRAIELLRNEWIKKLEANNHQLLGKATSAVTLISGGQRVNIIPDKCEALLDTRILPNQNPNEIIDSLQHITNDLCDVRCEITQPALETSEQLPFVQRLLRTCKAITGKGKPTGLSFLTDACQFARSGAKCIVFGPGSIEQAHSANEYVETEQLYQAAEILLNFLINE